MRPPEDGWDHFKQDANQLARTGLGGLLRVLVVLILLGPIIVLVAEVAFLRDVLVPIAIFVGLLLLLDRV